MAWKFAGWVADINDSKVSELSQNPKGFSEYVNNAQFFEENEVIHEAEFEGKPYILYFKSSKKVAHIYIKEGVFGLAEAKSPENKRFFKDVDDHFKYVDNLFKSQGGEQ